jgi:farnesyl-diphosphate farnesyltransferase
MPDTGSITDHERLDTLLLAASRTFAINIPMLPGLLRDSLTLGYLLLRNADTLEDAYRWPKARRLIELEEYHALILHPDDQAAERFGSRFEHVEEIDNPDHLNLLRQTPYLLGELRRLPPDYAEVVLSHVARVTRRMQSWVASHDDSNRLQLKRLSQLDDYCYSVAGIVGELVTSLIALYRPALEKGRLLFLRTLETGVGAGLQLTNIIKDSFRDHLEGRYYIPQEYLPLDGGSPLERMKPMFAYAYRHLCLGVEYACTLPEPELDIRKAVLVPLMLAAATLVLLLGRLEDLFAGTEVKISRETVAEILALVDHVAGENGAVLRAWRDITGPLAQLHGGYAATA